MGKIFLMASIACLALVGCSPYEMGLQHEEWKCRMLTPDGESSTWTFISNQPNGTDVKWLMVDDTPLGNEIGTRADILKSGDRWSWRIWPSPLPQGLGVDYKINFLLDRQSSHLRAHFLNSSTNQESLIISGRCIVTRINSPYP